MFKISTKRLIPVMAVASVIGMTCLSSGAQAGFEWVAPAHTENSNSMAMQGDVPPVPAMPVPPVKSEQSMTPMQPVMPFDPVTSGAPENMMAAPHDPMMPPPQDVAPMSPAMAPAPMMGQPMMMDDSGLPPMGHGIRPLGHTSADQMIIEQDNAMSGTAHVARPVAAPAPTAIAPVEPMAAPQLYKQVVGFGKDMPLVLAMRQIVPAEYSFAFDPTVNKAIRISWTGGKSWNRVLEDALELYGLTPVISGQTVWIKDGSRYSAKTTEPAIVTPMERSPRNPLPLMMKADVDPMGEPVEAMQTSGAPMALAPSSLPPSAARMPAPNMPPVPATTQAPSFYQPQISNRVVPGQPVYESQKVSYGIPRPTMEPSVPGGTPFAPSPGETLDPFAVRYWQAEEGQNLREVLTHWANMSGVTIYWGADPDYVLAGSIRMHGTFEQAVQSALQAFNDAGERPWARLHPNLPMGPTVLIVRNYGEY